MRTRPALPVEESSHQPQPLVSGFKGGMVSSGVECRVAGFEWTPPAGRRARNPPETSTGSQSRALNP